MALWKKNDRIGKVVFIKGGTQGGHVSLFAAFFEGTFIQRKSSHPGRKVTVHFEDNDSWEMVAHC